MKRVLLVACMAGTSLFYLGACSPQDANKGAAANEAGAQQTVKSEAKVSSEVSLADEGKLAQLISEAKGKVLVLNFWATWCPPCVKEMPEFVKFYNAYSPDKVAFISLSANEAAKMGEEVAPFQKDQGLPFPVYVLDANNPDKFYEALRVELSGALPATIIYGKDGVPKEVWEKDTTFEELKEAVEKLL